MIVYGLNAVLEAVRARGDRIRYVGVASASKKRLSRLIGEARSAGVPVRTMPASRINRLADGNTHNGVVAEIDSVGYAELEEIMSGSSPPDRIFALDGVQDPQNLGAILRVADGFGFGLVITPQHDSAGLTATTIKASAGAAEWVPVARVTNLARTLEELKDRGYWVYAADVRGDPARTIDFGTKVVLVLGSEGRGVRRNVLAHSDARVAIPLKGKVSSLNVSTAAAALAYEVDCQSRGRGRDA